MPRRPARFAAVILCFVPLFRERSWRHAEVVLIGEILAPGQRTVTSILRIVGLCRERRFTNYHRVLNRAAWSGRAAGHVLLGLLLDAFAPRGPVLLGLDDTIERRRGKRITAMGIYRDPVRSSKGHFVKASGLRWLGLMLLVPVPWAGRVWAPVGGGWPGDLDKSTLGHPGKYTYCVCENEARSPFAPYHVEHGFRPEDSTVFAAAAEAPHSVTDHHTNDPEGILGTMCSAMSTVASNNAVLDGHCVVVLGLEHARTISRSAAGRAPTSATSCGCTAATGSRGALPRPPLRQGVQPQPAEVGEARAGQPGPHRALAGQHPPLCRGRGAGRFSAFIPGWGRMSTPVLRAIGAAAQMEESGCVGGVCAV
jgi:hypothetical protein